MSKTKLANLKNKWHPSVLLALVPQLLLLAGAVRTDATVVCIDPGHPSEVGRGTAGRKITEIQAAWQVGLKLKSILNNQHIDTVLTKSAPYQKVTNRRRAEIGNGDTGGPRADLVVRLH